MGQDKMKAKKSADPKSRCLLIIEDEPELLEILVQTCEVLTPQILTASNGKAGLEVINSAKVDAILSDINMPLMTGLQLLAHIREEGLEVPFVFLSGYSDRNNVATALKLGATDFLEKPYEEEKLLKYVDLALDLGVALREVDNFYIDSNLPPDKLQKLKKAKTELWKMKALDKTYNKKKPA